MNEDKAHNAFDHRLRAALGSPEKADFDVWQARHADAVAHLNPVVTALKQRRRRLLMLIANATIAAGVCGLLIWLFAAERQSFAQTIKAIDHAQTVTWTTTFYERLTSLDGKRTWLRASRMMCAYRTPGLYRTARYDDEGNVSQVEITDSKINKTLRLDMKSKQAVSTTPTGYYGPSGPFLWLADFLKTKPLEWVGQRKWKDKTVNVFRFRRDKMEKPVSSDIWIDPETKQLVGTCDPGADYFDPTAEADRGNPAEKEFSMGKMLGSIQDEIVFDAKLDADLFSLTPPAGFEFMVEPPRPTVTEAELVEFLGATARFNNDTFFDNERGFSLDRINAAEAKNKADRTDAERKLIDLTYKHMGDQNTMPILDFAKDNTIAGSFRYLGKGVKLGSADRIVCWYKLKITGTYRAVFGDLTVKDVSPNDLPLPVDR